MADKDKVIRAWERCKKCSMVPGRMSEAYLECEYTTGLYCRRDMLIDDTIAVLKEQEADIIAMSRFLESHGWDSDSICGKNVEIVVTNGDDDDA